MKKTLSIIGGGTAGLFVAAFIDTKKYNVTIYDKNASFGRKFLVAGDGGFNLTHSENLKDFINRYHPNSFLTEALTSFTNDDLREWLGSIGIATYVGTSNRVFPKQGIKPIIVLRAIETYLLNKGIQFEYKMNFEGWQKNDLFFNGGQLIASDINIFALGGGSWKVTGSDGLWLNTFEEKNITTTPFIAQNCAFEVDWEEEFIKKHAGEPLKNIAVSIQGKSQKGEMVITEFGLEGNAIYALSPYIQNQLKEGAKSTINIDFKPSLSIETITNKLNTSKGNTSSILKEELKLSKASIKLIKQYLSKNEFTDSAKLAQFIKEFPITIKGSAPINEAISTSGGIVLEEVDPNFELLQLKNNYCIGEMLDWNAPTGGYLIQACASMGAYLAQQLNKN